MKKNSKLRFVKIGNNLRNANINLNVISHMVKMNYMIKMFLNNTDKGFVINFMLKDTVNMEVDVCLDMNNEILMKYIILKIFNKNYKACQLIQYQYLMIKAFNK